MRESLAKSVNAKNLEWDDYEKQIDRVAAMSSGTELGSMLLRTREGGQREFAHRVMLIIASRLIKRFRLNRDIAEKVSTQAIIEWCQPHCRTCGGARQMMTNKIVECHTCNSSGVHRYTDMERRQFIGSFGVRIEQALIEAHCIITGESGYTIRESSIRLGRD